MAVALPMVVFTVFGLMLGTMVRRAWGWTEAPTMSIFVQATYAAALPACLMAAAFVVVSGSIFIAGPGTHAIWAQVLVVAFLATVVVLGAAMYSTFTYGRPRALVPPALRREPQVDDQDRV
jgi:hypothetical protein